MPQVEYAVIATLPDEAATAEYVAWLTGGHVAEVVAGGALISEVIRLDAEAEGGPARIMSRYRFADRASFDRYVQDHAPRLRAEGLARFGSERGVVMQRIVGEVLSSRG